MYVCMYGHVCAVYLRVYMHLYIFHLSYLSLSLLLFISLTFLSSSLSRQYGGTGLGLSIAKGLVSVMRGSFERIQSTIGKGSTFAFVIPLNTTADKTTVVARLPQFGTKSKGKGRKKREEKGKREYICMYDECVC